LLSASAPQEIPPAVIQVEDVHCGYPGRDVLKGVSFTVRRGEFVGVLGPNGAGKTTLVLALSGVVPARKGSIEILGTPVDRLKHKDRARRMAVVAQDGELRFPFSCMDIVRMGRYPHQGRWQLDTLRDEEAVERAMDITDTVMFAQRLITALSGGERQRVIMAKALAQETPVLLLDEATSAMDIHRKLQVFRVLDRMNRHEGITVIAVMHDVNLAALFCRRMLFLKEGWLAADGPVDSVLTSELLEKIYETPVMVQAISGTNKKQVVFLP